MTEFIYMKKYVDYEQAKILNKIGVDTDTDMVIDEDGYMHHVDYLLKLDDEIEGYYPAPDVTYLIEYIHEKSDMYYNIWDVGVCGLCEELGVEVKTNSELLDVLVDIAIKVCVEC